MIEKCTPEEDKKFGGVIFWLTVTGQRVRHFLDGDFIVERLPQSVLDKRAKKRAAKEALQAAELKRARKAAKRRVM